MKSKIIAAAFGATLLANAAFARGGDRDLLVRGSQAWFAAESGEHVVKSLVLVGTIDQSKLTALNIDLTSTSTLTVALTTSEGQVTDSCWMVDEWSRGGTVLKKDVRCENVSAEPRNDLTRGTNAWAVVEGLEHSLRLAVTSDAGILEKVSAAKSSLHSDAAVLVAIELNDGSAWTYVCNRRSLNSLNCGAAN